MKSIPAIIPIIQAIPGINIEKIITNIPKTNILISVKIEPIPIRSTTIEQPRATKIQNACSPKPPKNIQPPPISMELIKPSTLKMMPKTPAIIAKISPTLYKLDRLPKVFTFIKTDLVSLLIKIFLKFK